MAAHPINALYVDTLPTPKAGLRGYFRDRVVTPVLNIAELQAMVTEGHRLFFVMSTGAFYYYDSADVSSADDGVSVIVSADARRYKKPASLTQTDSPRPRNRMLNGNFAVRQRGETWANTGFNADCWSASGTSAMAVVADAPAGLKWSAQMTAAGGAATQRQRIESAMCDGLASQQVAISFWAKSTTGSVPLSVRVSEATATNDFSSTVNAQTAVLAATPSGSWTRYTAVFTLGSSAGNGLQVEAFRDAGTTVTLVTGFQLEVGSVATAIETGLYMDELARCQRYYNRMSHDMVVPAAAAMGARWNFPVPMRITPTANNVTAGTLTNATLNVEIAADTRGGMLKITASAAGGSLVGRVTEYSADL